MNDTMFMFDIEFRYVFLQGAYVVQVCMDEHFTRRLNLICVKMTCVLAQFAVENESFPRGILHHVHAFIPILPQIAQEVG